MEFIWPRVSYPVDRERYHLSRLIPWASDYPSRWDTGGIKVQQTACFNGFCFLASIMSLSSGTNLRPGMVSLGVAYRLMAPSKEHPTGSAGNAAVQFGLQARDKASCSFKEGIRTCWTEDARAAHSNPTQAINGVGVIHVAPILRFVLTDGRH